MTQIGPVERREAQAGQRQRILLVGNHTCGNRGDAAILRGLLAALAELRPDAELVVTSRYPTSSSHLLGRPVAPDPMLNGAGLRRSRRLRALLGRLLPFWLAAAGTRRGRWLERLLPADVRRTIASFRAFDLVVQVGGSFFVDVYGARQYEAAFATILARRPLLLLGHSMGPFETRASRLLARRLLASATVVALREAVSLQVLRRAGLPVQNTVLGADTAWLMPTGEAGRDAAPPQLPERRKIALSLRDLAPFGERNGLSQSAYEAAFARLAEGFIEAGFDILLVSSCTGIDSYHRDDRMPALRLRALVGRPERVHVVMDELNDVELGQLLRDCDLVVATRLHCAIIAMRFGVPAIALNYEHKSEGILQRLELAHLALPLSALVDGRLALLARDLLAQLPETRRSVAAAAARERERALRMVREALEAVPPASGP